MGVVNRLKLSDLSFGERFWELIARNPVLFHIFDRLENEVGSGLLNFAPI